MPAADYPRKPRQIAAEAERNTIMVHFTSGELADMEKHARELSRMDWTDKVKLINQARRALCLESAFNAIRCHHTDPEPSCDACTMRVHLGEF